MFSNASGNKMGMGAATYVTKVFATLATLHNL